MLRSAVTRRRHPRVLLAAGLLLLATSCDGVDAGTPEAPPQPRRDVLLVVVDTLRADHLGCYGYDRPTSPNLDALAREGVVFERVVSASASTGPSVSSILTGSYPRYHSFGASNGSFLLTEEENTLAEAFAAAGYRTGAVVSNPVLPARCGFSQGFGTYDDTMEEPDPIRGIPERTAARTTDAAIAWLDGVGADEPFFLWVHYMDPHGPYTPPEDLRAAFAPDDPGPELPGPAGKDKNDGRGYVPWYQAIGERHFLGEYVGRYDAEIAYFDREFGRLLERLRRRGRYDDTVILVTADHGEAMGEGGVYFFHGHDVTPDQSFVPMVLKHPDVPAGRRSATPVGHVDVFPTLAASAGAGGGTSGRFPGADLVEAATSALPQRALFCEIRGRLGVYRGPVLAILPTEGGDAAQARFLGVDGRSAEVTASMRRDLLGSAGEYVAGPAVGTSPMVEDREGFQRILRSLGYAGD